MNTPLEALYVHACERRDLARWLSDPEKLLNNLQDVHSLELEMYFYQGVAIGLQLVSLTQFV